MSIFTGNSVFFCKNMDLNEIKYSTLCKLCDPGLARIHEFKCLNMLKTVNVRFYMNVTIICWLCVSDYYQYWLSFSVRLPITHAWHGHSLRAARLSVEFASFHTLSFITKIGDFSICISMFLIDKISWVLILKITDVRLHLLFHGHRVICWSQSLHWNPVVFYCL